LLLGPVSNKSYEDEGRGICHTQILKELETYASIVNPISIPGAETNGKDIDLLIIQQTDHGFQSDYPQTAEYDDVSSMWIMPFKKSNKIAEYAFGNATMGKRSKVSAFHQANIFKECHGEFLMNTRKIAKDTKDIKYEEMYLGEAATKLARDPEAFDLIVMPHNCGDIVSSIAFSTVGGEGMVPSVHIGDKHSVFQQGGTNPNYESANEGNANPTGMILSASMMLRQANLPSFADLLEAAVFDTYKNSDVRTSELGGNYSTKEFTEQVMKNIRMKPSQKSQLQKDSVSLEM